MATAEKTGTQAVGNKSASARPKPPVGFVNAGTPDIEGWFKPEKGLVLSGKIVGAIKIPDEKAPSGKRDVVLVRLKEACKAVKEQETIMLQPGQVMGVGIRHQLTELLYYVESKGEVWAYVEEQVNIGHGQTMWKFDGPHFDPKAERKVPTERFESGARMPSGPVPF